jgi:hypothetical protein
MSQAAPANNAPSPPPGSVESPIDSFLRPESMVTPGALGALTMLITNALATNFMWIGHAITALLLSFIFGVTAIVKANELWQKIIFYIINSLIIFSVATGSNQIGGNVASSATSRQSSSLILPSAYAQPAGQLQSHHTANDVVPIQFFQPWLPINPPPKQVIPNSPTNLLNQYNIIAPNDAESGWSVVVGKFANKSDADKARNEINNALIDHSAEISRNSSNEWVVTIGGNNLSLSNAAAIQKKAISDGAAKETFVMRSDQLKPDATP